MQSSFQLTITSQHVFTVRVGPWLISVREVMATVEGAVLPAHIALLSTYCVTGVLCTAVQLQEITMSAVAESLSSFNVHKV